MTAFKGADFIHKVFLKCLRGFYSSIPVLPTDGTSREVNQVSPRMIMWRLQQGGVLDPWSTIPDSLALREGPNAKGP